MDSHLGDLELIPAETYVNHLWCQKGIWI